MSTVDDSNYTPRTRRSKKLEKAILQAKKETNMPEELLQEYADAFELFDANEDGKVDAYELQELMCKVNERDVFDLKACKLMIDTVDKNNNKRIDFTEFVGFMAKSYIDYDTELKNAFDVFDENGNGTIAAEEMYNILNTLGENITQAEIKYIMDEVDTDKDGKIDFNEFKSMMQMDPSKIVGMP